MQKCPYCGNVVSEKAKFCQECGADMREQIVEEPYSTKEIDELYTETDGYETDELYKEDDLYETDEEEALYSRENRKTLTLGVVLAVLICVVGIGLYFVVSNMLQKQPEIDVGGGLSDKQVQVTPAPTKDPSVDAEETDGGQEETPQDDVLSITASVTTNGPEAFGDYQQAAFAGSQESTVLEDGGVYHVSGHMIDGNSYTSWQEGSEGDGSGDWVLVQLDRQYSVKYLTFMMGNWKSESLFYANNRPAQILLKLDDREFYLDFPDGMRTYTVELSEECQASSVLVQVLSVYNGANWNDCCITEMTVYGH